MKNTHKINFMRCNYSFKKIATLTLIVMILIFCFKETRIKEDILDQNQNTLRSQKYYEIVSEFYKNAETENKFRAVIPENNVKKSDFITKNKNEFVKKNFRKINKCRHVAQERDQDVEYFLHLKSKKR